MDITTLSLKDDRGPYNYRPQRPIDATEYKWQFEDIKPLTTLMARKYKDDGNGQAATSSNKVSFEVLVS